LTVDSKKSLKQKDSLDCKLSNGITKIPHRLASLAARGRQSETF